jgi:DNA polymerase III subunit beta
MKVTCDREKLLAGFQLAALIAPSRSPKAILQKIKLDTSGERAMLMATDMDVGIRLEPEGIEVSAAGAALLPVSRFNSILRESSDEKLHIEADSQGSVVRGEHSEFKLPAENPDEFPQVATFQEEKFHVIPAKLFRELVRRTLFATDVESSRYALGGVFLEFGEDKITAVGTDGRRLAKMEGPVQAVGSPNLGENTTIVPTRSMQLLERVISDDDTEIQLAVRPNDILVKTPRAVIY